MEERINGRCNIVETFAKRLIALRKEKRLTQTEMAEILNMSRSGFAGYETDGKEPSFESLCFLADFFDVTVEYLLGRSDDRKPKSEIVFLKDNKFKAKYDTLPETLKETVSDTYDSFYSLLDKAVQKRQGDYLAVYRGFFSDLKNIRAELQSRTENAAGSAAEMAELFALEGKAKELMTSTLDKLMQLDLDGAASKEAKKKIG